MRVSHPSIKVTTVASEQNGMNLLGCCFRPWPCAAEELLASRHMASQNRSENSAISSSFFKETSLIYFLGLQTHAPSARVDIHRRRPPRTPAKGEPMKMPFRAVKLCKPCLNKKYPLRKQLLLSFLTLSAVSDICPQLQYPKFSPKTKACSTDTCWSRCCGPTIHSNVPHQHACALLRSRGRALPGVHSLLSSSHVLVLSHPQPAQMCHGGDVGFQPHLPSQPHYHSCCRVHSSGWGPK